MNIKKNTFNFKPHNNFQQRLSYICTKMHKPSNKVSLKQNSAQQNIKQTQLFNVCINKRCFIKYQNRVSHFTFKNFSVNIIEFHDCSCTG